MLTWLAPCPPGQADTTASLRRNRLDRGFLDGFEDLLEDLRVERRAAMGGNHVQVSLTFALRSAFAVRPNYIWGNSGFVVGRLGLLGPVPRCQEAEKPYLRKETDGNSGRWECITVLVVVSGEDPEVWDDSFAERQFLDYQASITHRKQGN